MSRCILTVTVNPAVDLTFSVLRSIPTPRLKASGVGTPTSAFGGTSEPTSLVLSAGGKGINVARALRNLGVRVLAAGVAGGEMGNFFRELLRKEKIPAALVRTKEPTRLNVTILGPRLGSLNRVIQEGPQLTSKEIRRFESEYWRWLRHSHFVVLSGRNAVGAPVDWYARLVRLAQRQGVPAAVDTSGAALCAALKAKPFLIKPNRTEVEEILQCRINSPVKIKNAVRRFHGRGICVVVLSLGARGAVVSDGKNICYAHPPRVHAVNEVGCGDALLAGFIQAYCARKSLPEALRRGVACGTANVLNSTPGLIHPNDVLGLVKKVTVKNWGTSGR